jgi:hypothetical protein
MEILNETVYDSNDLHKVIVYARDWAHRSALDWHRTRPIYAGVPPSPPPQPKPLPAKIRFGYYAGKKNTGGSGGDSMSYVYRSGTGYRSSGQVARIGIVRPTDLPLEAMEVVALAAADKSKRTLPNVVMHQLVLVLVRSLFEGLFGDDKEVDYSECMVVHYDHRPDQRSSKESRELARAERLRRAEREVAYLESHIVHLKTKLTKAEEKIIKSRERLDRLKAKQEGVTSVR